MPVQIPLCCQRGQASREALQDVAVLALQSAVAPLLHALAIQQIGLQGITATSRQTDCQSVSSPSLAATCRTETNGSSDNGAHLDVQYLSEQTSTT